MSFVLLFLCAKPTSSTHLIVVDTTDEFRRGITSDVGATLPFACAQGALDVSWILKTTPNAFSGHSTRLEPYSRTTRARLRLCERGSKAAEQQSETVCRLSREGHLN